jgi:hypothetical protein
VYLARTERRGDVARAWQDVGDRERAHRLRDDLVSARAPRDSERAERSVERDAQAGDSPGKGCSPASIQRSSSSGVRST